MDTPKIAGREPLPVVLEAGKKYAWCACGMSSNQPFCDGQHKSGNFSPITFTAEKNKTVYLCTCKQTSNPGFCDGSHKTL